MSRPLARLVRSSARGSTFMRLANPVGILGVAGILGGAALAACGSSPATGPLGATDAGSGGPDALGVAEVSGDGPLVRSHCPAGQKGASLARVGWAAGVAFCIDTTEVTNAEYRAFLDAAPDPGAQPERCRGWNTSFAPAPSTFKATNGPACPSFDLVGPVGRADSPVVCVNWCDADAYCRWAGKRLCERPGGGGSVLDPTDPHGDEWVIACTGDQARRYPYDSGPVVARCVDRRYPQVSPDVRPVKEASACEGGVPGVFDMSGNAWEWTNDCTASPTNAPTAAGGDACLPRGGSFSSDVTAASCFDTVAFHRQDVAGDTGFRCCSDAVYGAAP